MGSRCVCRHLLTGLSLPLAALLGAGPSLVSTAVMAQGITGLAPSANRNPLQERSQRFQGVWSRGGMVSSSEPRASQAGVQILRQGGNAVDAAVASSFALAVTHPQAGNLGGGGFLVLWLPGPSPAGQRGCLDREASVETGAGPELAIGGGTAVAVNFREAAPRKAKQDLFLRPDGSVDRRRATRSLLSTGVPGSVAGLTLVQRCYGRLPLATVMAPAIRLAERGFAVSPGLSSALADAAPMLQADPSSRDLFFRPLGPMVKARSGVDPAASAGPLRALRPGEILHQPALAATLRRISIAGDRGFYTGPVAHSLVTLMRQGGGLIDHGDLQAYQAQLVQPLLARFRDHPVLTMPPPSSGITLLQLLKMLEPFELASTGMNSASTLHTMVEAMNLAYRDRNALLGDPDQTEIPVQRLLAEPYITALRAGIDLHRHRPSDQLDSPAPALPTEGTNTTHLSVADREGGLVATTTTLNFSFGNGISVPEAGFLLNNEMDDFTAKPGSPNAFGLMQGTANAIAPGRRPLSSMSPTLVFRPGGEPWLATGSPGGSRIITTVLQVLLNRIIHGVNLATAVASPRVHSQLWPDLLQVEEGISPDTSTLLEAMGHRLQPTFAMGAANSVEILLPKAKGHHGAPNGGGSTGVVDPRRAEGTAQGE